MRLYTRTGDDGTTGLFGSERVRKDDLRIHAIGEVDESNAAIGLACAAAHDGEARGLSPEFAAVLVEVQARLFDVGADLATPHGSVHESKVARVGADAVGGVERLIDRFDSANAPLTTFVLPGGSECAARLHMARVIVRRAERAVLALSSQTRVNEHALPLLNRLSDLLFAMARAANRELGVADVEWRPHR